MTPEEKIAALRDALEKNLIICSARNCRSFATWNIYDFELDEYACDKHLESECARWNVSFNIATNELLQARLAIAVLAETA